MLLNEKLSATKLQINSQFASFMADFYYSQSFNNTMKALWGIFITF